MKKDNKKKRMKFQAKVLEFSELTEKVSVMVERKINETTNDRICGHWVRTDIISYTATIIKNEDDDYMLSVFDGNIIAHQALIVPDGKKLKVKELSADETSGIVSLMDEGDTLYIQGYGNYVRDHIAYAEFVVSMSDNNNDE